MKLSKWCVLQVNITQETAEIACTGLYRKEAEMIAQDRNRTARYYEKTYEQFRNEVLELSHQGYTPIIPRKKDKIAYTVCRNHPSSIEFAAQQIIDPLWFTK